MRPQIDMIWGLSNRTDLQRIASQQNRRCRTASTQPKTQSTYCARLLNGLLGFIYSALDCIFVIFLGQN